MTKVYLLSSGTSLDGDYTIHGIFSSHEKFQQWLAVNKQNEHDYWLDWFDLDQATTIPPPAPMHSLAKKMAKDLHAKGFFDIKP